MQQEGTPKCLQGIRVSSCLIHRQKIHTERRIRVHMYLHDTVACIHTQCIYVYTCMYVHANFTGCVEHTYRHTCACVRLRRNSLTSYMNKHNHACKHKLSCMHACIRALSHAIQTCMHAYTHAYINLYRYIYIYTCTSTFR